MWKAVLKETRLFLLLGVIGLVLGCTGVKPSQTMLDAYDLCLSKQILRYRGACPQGFELHCARQHSFCWSWARQVTAPPL